MGLRLGFAWRLASPKIPRARCLAPGDEPRELEIPTNRYLVGEQSNAYRILLRYDRKSRHRRIKKQRRYERLAATSQFLGPTTFAGREKLVPKDPPQGKPRIFPSV